MIVYKSTNTLFAQSTDNSTAINLKAKTMQANTGSDFKALLDKTLNNTSKNEMKNTSDSSNSNRDRQAAGDAETKPRYNSFREVQAEKTAGTNQSNVKKASNEMKAEEVSLEQEAAKMDDKSDEQIALLAQMLGISPGELLKLADKLGFSAEELKDVKKLTLFVQKLGDLLELSNSQKDILQKIAEEVSKQAESVESSSENKPAESTVKSAASDNGTGIDADKLSKLSADLKAKIDAMIKEGKTDTESISSEISKIIASMKAQAQNRVNINSVSDKSSEITQKPDSISENPEAKPELKQEAKTDKVEEDVTAKETASDKVTSQVDAKSAGVQVNVSNDQNQQQQPMQAFGDVRVSMVNTQNTAAKSDFVMPQTVKSGDVMNQVVEQTKVVIGQDKTEMVINLKPDHLGKLELKVVTEQGIVAAKFITENQKVKEIIETNMQLLKDSLEKQGIAIDSVSVQVGHDRKGDYQQNSYPGKSGSSSSRVKYGTDSAEAVAGVSGASMEILPERLAQYSYETSTINLKA